MKNYFFVVSLKAIVHQYQMSKLFKLLNIFETLFLSFYLSKILIIHKF
jgi:hypothetical protein